MRPPLIRSALRGDRLSTATGRAVLGALAGAAAGSAANMAGILVMELGSGEAPALGAGIYFAAFSSIIALIPWAAGIGILGAPLWWLLDKLALRGWLTMALAGAAVPAGFMSLILFNAGPARLVEWIAIYAVSGVCAGLAIWRVAYSKANPAAEVFS